MPGRVPQLECRRDVKRPGRIEDERMAEDMAVRTPKAFWQSEIRSRAARAAGGRSQPNLPVCHDLVGSNKDAMREMDIASRLEAIATNVARTLY